MSLLPGDDYHTHVQYSDVASLDDLRESVQTMADRLDKIEEQLKFIEHNLTALNPPQAPPPPVTVDEQGGE